MNDKYIVLVEFLFRHSNQEVEGAAALFFNKYDTIPITDQEIVKEIELQYGYDVIKIIHKQKKINVNVCLPKT